MTLGFTQKCPQHMGEWAGQPNYFVEKIWGGLNPDKAKELGLSFTRTDK